MVRVQQLFLREWFRIRESVRNQMVNSWLIWPVLFGYRNGYFVPLAAFGGQSQLKATELVLGMNLFMIVVTGFFMVLDIINERLDTKVLQYHISVTSFRTTFFVRLIFTVLYAYILILPFCAVVKLVLGSWFITTHVSWPLLALILLLGTTLTITYLFCWIGILDKISNLEHMWERGVEPVMWLAGVWAPGYAIAQSGVPGMALLTTINPFLYVSEAIRQIFLPGPQYASLATCCIVMVSSSIVFTLISYHLLKHRMDLV